LVKDIHQLPIRITEEDRDVKPTFSIKLTGCQGSITNFSIQRLVPSDGVAPGAPAPGVGSKAFDF